MPTYIFEFNSCTGNCAPTGSSSSEQSLSLLLNKGILQIKNISGPPTKQILELYLPGTGQYQIQKINLDVQNFAIFSTKIPNTNINFVGDAIVSFYEDISELCDFTISQGYLVPESSPSFIEVTINSINSSAIGSYIYIYYSSSKTKKRYIIPIPNDITELVGKTIQIYGETEDNVNLDVMCVKEINQGNELL